MSGRNQFTAAQFIEAVNGTGRFAKSDKRTGCMGIISTVADRVGCNWHTAKKYCTRSTTPFITIAKAYEDELEKSLDFTETQMLRQIQDGDGPMIRYHLSTRGKHRGYVMREERSGPDGGPIETKETSNYGPAEHARALTSLFAAVRSIGDQEDGGGGDGMDAAVPETVDSDTQPSG